MAKAIIFDQQCRASNSWKSHEMSWRSILANSMRNLGLKVENIWIKTIHGESSEQNLVNKWSMILLVTITSSNYSLQSQITTRRCFPMGPVVELPPRLPLVPTSTQRRRKGSAKTCITPWGRNDQIIIPVIPDGGHHIVFVCFPPFGQFVPIWRGLYCHSFKQQDIKNTWQIIKIRRKKQQDNKRTKHRWNSQGIVGVGEGFFFPLILRKKRSLPLILLALVIFQKTNDTGGVINGGGGEGYLQVIWTMKSWLDNDGILNFNALWGNNPRRTDCFSTFRRN